MTDAPQCLPYDAMLGALGSNYSETVQATGLAATGDVVQVTASDGGTWTILIIDAAGQACIAAHGEAYTVTRARPNL